MKRHRRSYLSGLFYNTGNYDVRTVGEGFGFSRQFTDTINQELMDDERIAMERQKAEAQRLAEEQENADKPTENPNDMPERQ